MKTNKKKFFSIITVVKNGGKFIENTILSVQNQVYKSYEHIIVDGMSTDKTCETIEKYLNENVVFLREYDDGIYDAMNKGLDLATGEYLIFLNAGDEFSGDNILFDVANNLTNDIDVAYGDSVLVDKNEIKIKYLKAKEFNIDNLLRFGTRTLCHQAMFVKRKFCPSYNKDYFLKGELDWYFELLKSLPKCCKLNIAIVNYRLGGISEKKYLINTIEAVKVIYKWSGMRGVFIYMPTLFYKLIGLVVKK